MIDENDIDTIITKGMLETEQVISLHRVNHPWPLDIDKAILNVQYWKVTQSQLLNKQQRRIALNNIISRMTI